VVSAWVGNRSRCAGLFVRVIAASLRVAVLRVSH
jgi:hypothetical protein